MLKLYSSKAAERILRTYRATIDAVAARYALPAPLIEAVLYTAITGLDLLDPLADLLVRINTRRESGGLLGKRDSSTGYGQIFGFVAINAANFAVERGLTSYAALGLPERRLDPNDAADLRLVWTRLNREPEFNIEMSSLNLLCAAEEVTGRVDFSSYSPEELQRILTRYNGTLSYITPYGEKAYREYLRFAAALAAD